VIKFIKSTLAWTATNKLFSLIAGTLQEINNY